jgi:hypothetical protein
MWAVLGCGVNLLESFKTALWHGNCIHSGMKTKKQARTDHLNESAHNWVKHLDKHYSETRLTTSQVLYYSEKIAKALVDLRPDSLTINQIQAVITLISSSSNCAHTCGVELGKSFNEEN